MSFSYVPPWDASSLVFLKYESGERYRDGSRVLNERDEEEEMMKRRARERIEERRYETRRRLVRLELFYIDIGVDVYGEKDEGRMLIGRPRGNGLSTLICQCLSIVVGVPVTVAVDVVVGVVVEVGVEVVVDVNVGVDVKGSMANIEVEEGGHRQAMRREAGEEVLKRWSEGRKERTKNFWWNRWVKLLHRATMQGGGEVRRGEEENIIAGGSQGRGRYLQTRGIGPVERDQEEGTQREGVPKEEKKGRSDGARQGTREKR